MLIWIILAIVLVVIVAGGFVGRSRLARQKEQAKRNGTHHTTHHGKGARRSRGRGRR
jgi:flagellar basal body-associated protein FliL